MAYFKRTELDACRTTMPIGTKIIPRITKEAITHVGVRIGCQAFNLCCLNAVSVNQIE
jgi:hypothetical protein